MNTQRAEQAFELCWPAPKELSFDRAGRVTFDAHTPLGLEVHSGGSERAQGFELHATPTGLRARVADEAGARHARLLLAQLVRLCDGRYDGPAFHVRDWPDFAVRGLMLDISRTRVPTQTYLFELVATCAALRLNQLQLYTEHTFAYAGHEEVWRDASPITPDEARALDAHCARNGIELVANQQCFGHLHRWLARERYRALAEVPAGVEHAWSFEREPFALCPGDPGALALLEGWFDQLLPCFTSRQLNAGFDETFDLGLGRSQADCQARGKGRVYLEFLQRVHQSLARRGARMQFWGDIIVQHPELIPELPRDLVALEWGYDAGHPFASHARRFQASGLEFYVCPGTSSWQSIAGRATNMLANVREAAVHGHAAGARGYLITDWGDRGHLQPRPTMWPGILAGAGLAWNASATLDPARLARLLDAHVFEGAATSLGAPLLELADCYLATGSPATNGSALFFLLAFAHADLPHARTPNLTLAGLARAREVIESARQQLDAQGLDESAPRARDRADLVWAAELLAFACDLGSARLEHAPGAPIASLPHARRTALASTLRALIERYEHCWLARERRGGLEESSAWLGRVLLLLEG